MTESEQDKITAWLEKLLDGVNNSNSMALAVAKAAHDAVTKKKVVAQ